MSKIVRSGQIRKCTVCKQEFATTERLKMCCCVEHNEVLVNRHKRAQRKGVESK